ncbi:hypothetical protein As57867_004984, partial [Aphanomyces stellatus]
MTVTTPILEASQPAGARGFVRTLLWKNFLLKRKHPVKWLFEVLLPVLLIVGLGLMKMQMENSVFESGWTPWKGKSDVLFTGLKPSSYLVNSEKTMSNFLVQIASERIDGYRDRSLPPIDKACRVAMNAGNVSLDKSSPFAYPSTCLDYLPTKIAIVPDNAFTRQYFVATLSQWYPRVPLGPTAAVPSLADSVSFFPSEDALEKYILDPKYGVAYDTPPLAAAIVFTTMPSTLGTAGNMEYSLRFNSTTELDRGTLTVPHSTLAVVDPLQRKLDAWPLNYYASSGFLTLQTLVTRFATCVPDWKDGKTTGTCTAANSVAVASPEVDTQLRQQIVKEGQFARLLADPDSTKSRFTDNASSISLPAEAWSLLLKPLRQLPQSTGGSLVFPFPIDGYTESGFYDAISFVFGIFFVISYLQCLSSILVALISEKESKTRELIKILGVPDMAIVTSWYITYGAVLFLGSVLQTAAAKAVLFENSDIFLLFLFFLFFSYSLMAYGYMVSAIFSKAKVGSYMGIIGFFLMYLISVAFTDTSPEAGKTLASLLPPVALVFGVSNMAAAETNGVGITFANVNESIKNYRFSTSLIVLLVDCVLYTLLGLYLERVVPKDYGVTETWYFPVSPSYWRRRRAGRQAAQPQSNDSAGVALDIVNDAIEPVGADLKQQEKSGDALQIRNLRKVFSVPGGEKVAVEGMHLTMYKNQITCLLGHNGAGKTTLISMLTGMIPTTSGDATVHGLSLHNDLDVIRRSMGVCPQHDVLYPDLTVYEHLAFYGKIKGFTGPSLEDQINASIAEVGLTEKRLVPSSELSGGMKRKLSLAIALLGDSQLVFLDEPTSGMDPYSRRSSWEIIMNNRPNRIIVLTTHFMDEADILGDRIAIMAEGELRCCGSSLFLKNRYGAGYNFSLVKAEHCDTTALIDFVSSHVVDAKVLSNVGTEIAFQLPLHATHLFAPMFAALDDNLSGHGILSYGISVTTMEEVFIKVAELGDERHQHTLPAKTKP